jgi:hypothetical protein
MNGFIDHLYTPLGTTCNYRAIANLHTLQNTTVPSKPSSSLLCLRQPFSSNGFYNWKYFSFPRSLRYCPVNIPQLTVAPTVFKITPRHGSGRKQPLYCCRGVLTVPLLTNCRGADHVENTVLLLLRAYLATTAVYRVTV